ncbi:DUF421 domain-containing protein [Hymenobacter sp. RP-2-7]|uniref:DUF421 domain-containing protein n=1 Tax=Hymenobacter polaris TaxID=2682546 RepID=A0A7Y0AH90_9BACT|nr:YetF domain-containing protein [Hymenobacter polaris]NML67255.1 DUF421 domain-containing protein [Hymenobacter polaris]
MEKFFVDLLGLHETAQTIAWSQVVWRTISVFLLAIALLRISGRRTFASNSALDMVIKFMTGAMLSQSILATLPYWVPVLGFTTLILLHRALAYITYFFPTVGRIIRGAPSVLAVGTEINHAELRLSSLSEADMMAAIRSGANLNTLTEVKTVRLEHDGQVSVVKKEKD